MSAFDPEPFLLSPVLSNLYPSDDLLDFSAPGPSSPPRASASGSPAPGPSSILASASSFALSAGRRAAAVASSATGTPQSSSPSRKKDGLLTEFVTEDDNRRRSVEGGRIETKCAEGYGNNLYIGRSDGLVEWWTCDGSQGSTQNTPGWTMRHQYAVFPRRPISQIILLPQLSRCFVLAEGTMHPLNLPFLENLPSTVIAPLRGVVSVILDDDELEWHGEGAEQNRTEMTMVIVRRRGLGIYRVGGRMTPQKEIPLPSAPEVHALASNYLCVSLPHSSTYALIDLSDASLTEVLPVSQIDASDLSFVPKPNIAVIPGEGEFLVTSYTGVSTMGVFLNGQGDPVRGTIEWPEHPSTLTVESGYIIALLQSTVVSIHSLVDLERPIQIVSLEPHWRTITLSYSPYGVSVQNIIRDEMLGSTRMVLMSGKLAPSAPSLAATVDGSDESRVEDVVTVKDLSSTPAVGAEPEDPPSGSGLTPPSSPPPFARQPITPQRTSSLLQTTAPSSRSPFSTAIAETLIIGPHDIQALLPLPPILRLQSLCEEARLDEAIALVDEEKLRGRRGEFDGDKPAHQATLRYLHLYLACHLFLETRFEIAGDHFSRGKMDPRLLVRLFPRLRGKVIGSAEEVEVPMGLKQTFEDMPVVEDIITSSIKRNYSPHIYPDTEHAPETIELRHALEAEAGLMLTELLKKVRQSRRKGGGGRGVDSRKIDIVIDTALAKLLAEAGTTNELLALLAGPNDVVLSELEPFLEKRRYVLATVMRKQGRNDRVLEILKSIAESEDGDPLCEDPVDEIAQQLDTITDPDMFRKYAFWLIGKDPAKGLDIFIAQSSKTGMKFNDSELLSELRAIDEEAANRYLEYVVVHKRSPKRALHQELLERLLDSVKREIEDDGVKYHLEELDAEFRLRPEALTFGVFLAEAAPRSPIKSLRLKLLLFLQGSPFYDIDAAASTLSNLDPLRYEYAIVLGRQTKHRQVLKLLAIDVRDAVSAQTYCTQGGEVVPPRVAHAIAGYVPELAAWATLGDVGRKKKPPVNATLRETLIMELLGVYMRERSDTLRPAASLLNAQSIHLDLLQVLQQMPSEWPADAVATFYKRTLRRQLHERDTWQILKSIAAGQNLEVSEAYLDKVLSLRPTVLDGPSPGFSAPDEGSIPGEERAWEEKSPPEVEDEEEEKQGGFFSPQAISKELAELKADDAIDEVS